MLSHASYNVNHRALHPARHGSNAGRHRPCRPQPSSASLGELAYEAGLTVEGENIQKVFHCFNSKRRRELSRRCSLAHPRHRADLGSDDTLMLVPWMKFLETESARFLEAREHPSSSPLQMSAFISRPTLESRRLLGQRAWSRIVLSYLNVRKDLRARPRDRLSGVRCRAAQASCSPVLCSGPRSSSQGPVRPTRGPAVPCG